MAGAVLWDVDTQVDFISAAGRLSVPDAESALPAMARLVEAARAAGIPHVASADDHELSDAEISAEPDFLSTYPPHCLRGTRGAEKVGETQQVDPVPLALTEVRERWLRGREFLLLKKSFDVFTNPHSDRLLRLLDPEEVIVFGVASDVCNDAAVRGLLARGLPVTYVAEAARGLDAERTAACEAGWRARGVRFASVDEVMSALAQARHS